MADELHLIEDFPTPPIPLGAQTTPTVPIPLDPAVLQTGPTVPIPLDGPQILGGEVFF